MKENRSFGVVAFGICSSKCVRNDLNPKKKSYHQVFSVEYEVLDNANI